jgi:hypothetical protein
MHVGTATDEGESSALLRIFRTARESRVQHGLPLLVRGIWVGAAQNEHQRQLR